MNTLQLLKRQRHLNNLTNSKAVRKLILDVKFLNAVYDLKTHLGSTSVSANIRASFSLQKGYSVLEFNSSYV